MRYFANPCTQPVHDAMTAGLLDCITTPAQGNVLPEGVRFCADNGKYGKGWPGEDAWWGWLQRQNPELCAFAVAPDVPFDALATLDMSLPWLERIRGLGIPAALAFQDGIENLLIPWDAFDVMFIAGTTEWKLGPHAAALTAEAKSYGLTVHMGRVNSARRFRRALHTGCDSVDGTYLTYGPDINLPKLLGWLRLNDQGDLFAEVS